jgi:hypothetical protein
MSKPKIGEYRLIPKGVVVWSIDHQSNISFEKDEIVKITTTVILDDNYFYGELSQCLFNAPGLIPGMIGKGSSAGLGIRFSETKPYEVPKPKFPFFWDWSFGNKKEEDEK